MPLTVSALQVGPNEFVATGTITNAGAAEVVTISGVPGVGRVVRMGVWGVTPLAASVNPLVSASGVSATAGPAILQATPVAARALPETALLVDTASALARYYAPGGLPLYLWPQFGAGAANSAQFSVLILAGW